MKKKYINLFLSAGLLTTSVFAGTMGPAEQPADLTWVGTFSVGPVWERAGWTQNIAMSADDISTYAAHKTTNSVDDAELFLGLQKTLSQRLQGQLGLAFAKTAKARLTGDIWTETNPVFDDFSYNYKIHHSHIALKGKLLANSSFWLIPWVSGSAGVGLTKANSYGNIPKFEEVPPGPDFLPRTKTSFTYTLGAGVQKALNNHWQIGVGYEFADWGLSQLAPALVQETKKGLTLNHLYTSGVLFNLTYLA